MTKRNRNKKSAGRTVLFQHLKDVKANANYSGERSPHWDWMDRQAKPNQEDEKEEHPRANPDMLAEVDDGYNERREHYSRLIEEVYKVLSPQEKKVFGLLQTSLGEAGIGEQMGISRSTVGSLRRRIVKKFKKLDSKTRIT